MFKEGHIDAAMRPSLGRPVTSSTEAIVITIGCLFAEDIHLMSVSDSSHA